MAKLFDLLSENSKNDNVISSLRKMAGKEKSESRGKARPAAGRNQGHFEGKSPTFDFVAIDVETTGLDSRINRIIEIGAVKFHGGKAVAEYSSLVNPQAPLPAAITQLTGITEDDLAGAPLFEGIVEALMDFIGGQPLCGHQIEFDTNFINEEFKRIGRDKFTAPEIDTALLSRIVIPDVSRFNLKHVSRSLGIALENAHRALDDARASGNAACALIAKLDSIAPHIRAAMARFAPPSLIKTLLFRSLDRSYEITDRPLGGITQALPKRLGEAGSPSELSAEALRGIFSSHGRFSEILKGYVERPSQLRMALCVGEALNTNTFLVAEAGTGTGKSLAYLVPAALFACRNNRRILVSTHTRNLQDQLVGKDLPLVRRIAGDELRYSVLKGRNNYLCIRRFHRLLSGELVDLSYRERLGVLPLIRWAHETTTGDIEEQSQFNIKWFGRVWRMINADAHLCEGKRCGEYNACFLQNARARALGSHIVVINHSLFYSEICSESSFLGEMGSVIFDEAHHLEASGHRHLRVELDTNRFMQYLDNLSHFEKELKAAGGRMRSAEVTAGDFRSLLKRLRGATAAYLDDLNGWVSEKRPPSNDYQLDSPAQTFSQWGSCAGLLGALSDMQDMLHTLAQGLESGDAHQDDESLLRPQVRMLGDRTSQLKADLDYVSSAATEGHVFWIEGNLKKGWSKLCGVPLDIGSILSLLWEKSENACVFTSATLSVSRSMEYFKRKTGLCGSNEAKTRTEAFESPFRPEQTYRVAMRSAPDVDSPEYPDYAAGILENLMTAFHKNILALFTSNAMLEAVYARCKDLPGLKECVLLAQGISGNRQTILDDFKSSGRAVLLGADSFWEGIDAPGKACEIVVIPRLPFQVPTHPLTRALAQKIETEEGESFFSYAVPEAIIKFRQGTGRLIRSTEDRGALVVLDHRILTKSYGKRFRESLEGEMRAAASAKELIEGLRDFFQNKEDCPPPVTYVPVEEL